MEDVIEINPATGEPLKPPPGVTEIDTRTGAPMVTISQSPSSLMQTVKSYLGIHQPKTTPLDIEALRTGERPYDIREEVFGTGKVEEFRRVVGRGMAGLTGGLSDLVKGFEENPETWPGAIAGAGAELGGFILGPLRGANMITGSRYFPTLNGLRGTAKIMAQGGATLGLASAISSIIPSFMKDENFTNLAIDVSESAGMGALVGAIYPAAGMIENKPLRLAVTLAVMDKIRAGYHQWFTIDDVVEGIHNGTIDAKELAHSAFNYLMDIYFTLKVPGMKKDIEKFDHPVIKDISKQDVNEAEKAVMETAPIVEQNQPLLEKMLAGEEPTQPIVNPDIERELETDLLPTKEELLNKQREQIYQENIPYAERPRQPEMFKGSEIYQVGKKPIIGREPGPEEFFASIPTEEQLGFTEVKSVREKIKSVPDASKDSLVSFLKKSGGINYNKEHMKGELDRLMPKETAGHGIGLINKQGHGYTLDDALRLSKEEGYLPEDAQIPDLLNILEGELYRGQKAYSTQKQDLIGVYGDLSLDEQIAMERQRLGGGEIGAIGLPQTQPGNIINLPKLEQMRNDANLEYKRTIGDKIFDVFPFLRDPRRYLSSTTEGHQLAEKTIELERTLIRAGNIAQEQVDKAFEGMTPEQSVRIGKALDGRETLTDPAEIKVAARVRRILNFYANALGLPPDKRIADYFPHLFRGQYRVRIRDAEGVEHTIPGGFSDTQRQAYAKAEQYLSMLPKDEAAQTTLVIEDTFRPELMGDAAQGLDYKRFMALKDAILEEKPVEEQVKLAGKLGFGPGPKPKVFFRHMMKREVNLQGFEEDSYKVMKMYIRGATRKIYFDRYLPEAEKLIDRMPESQKAYAERLVEYMRGVPSVSDKAADTFLKGIGLDTKPYAVSRITNAVNRYFYITKLGLGNLSGAAVNSLTLFTNAPVKIGPRALGEGLWLYGRSYTDKKLQAIIKREGPQQMRFGDTQLDVGGKISKALEATASPFQLVEDMTHQAVFLGARNKYLREHLKTGMTKAQEMEVRKQASQYGRDMDLETQIPQSRATRAPMFRDPTVRTALQFKTFMIKMAETIVHMTPAEKAGFVALVLLIGGPFAFPGVRYLSQRDPEIADAVDKLNNTVNIPRMMGFDFSGDVGVGFVPEDLRSMAGPTGQLLGAGVEGALKMATGESIGDEKSRIIQTLKPSFPSRIMKGIEQIKTGVIKDERGRPVIGVTPTEALSYTLFGSRSKAAADTYEKNRRFIVLEQKEKAEREDLLDAFANAREDSDKEAMDKLMKKIFAHNEEYGKLLGTVITPAMLANAVMSRHLSKEQRLLLHNKRKGMAYKQFMGE